MNRKSIVQIFVLVLLVAVGTGVYMSQQPGGLDFFRELIGLGPSNVPAVASHRPVHRAAVPRAKPKPKPLMAAKAKPKPPASRIPAHPARGRLFNAAFTVESAEIKDGVLTLRQGAGPGATDVEFLLHTKPWHVPAGRRFHVPGDSGHAPTVHVRRIENGRQEPSEHDVTGNYTLDLELGKVHQGKLPGKIYFALPDAHKSHIAGTFTADVRGFHFVGGKPDLAIDSVDTLQYLALRHVLRPNPDMRLTEVAFRQGRFAANQEPPTGYIEIAYRAGDAPAVERKFQFVKEQDRWRIVATLEPDQLDAAHPREAPGPGDPPERLFPYLAAKKIEADVRRHQAGGLLLATDFATRYSKKKKVGVTSVGYKVGDGDPVRATFLFRLNGNGWKLVRELKGNERLNLASGKVERRR